MTGADLRNALEQSLTFIDAIAPVAAALGGENVAKAAAVTVAVADFTRTAMAAVDSGQVVLAATDAGVVRDLAATIQLRNDALAEAIAAS